MKRILSAVLALTMLLCCFGCSTAPEKPAESASPSPAGTPEPSGSPSTVPLKSVDYTPSGVPDEAAGDLGAALLRLCRREGENTLVSPLSILSALAMTAEGADGETLREMEAVLGGSMDGLRELLHSILFSLTDEDGNRLSLANSVWLRDYDGLAVNPDFLAACRDGYDASVTTAPFDGSTVDAINSWCREHTDGMIDGIIDDIDEDTMMYLINALAFEAEWERVYDEYDVHDGIFTREDGAQSAVELMHSSEHDYLSDGLATGFLKYYSGRDYAFAALLPNEGVSITEYLDTLTGERIKSLLDGAEDVKVTAAIPKFEAEYSVSLAEPLAALGMEDAFDPDTADFSRMGSCADGNLYVGDVLHKTFISVGERGTKAGAVTAVMMAAESAIMAPEEVKTVILDRPFVYMLIDCRSDTPFFIGSVEDIGEPTGESVAPLVPSVSVGETVENLWGGLSLSLDLPEGWTYSPVLSTDEGKDFGIEFRPEGRDGTISVTYYDFFGVCGTGLEVKETWLPGGLTASAGYYDGSDDWSYMVLDVPAPDDSESYASVVAERHGVDWYDEYEDEVLGIIGSTRLLEVSNIVD